MWVCRRWRQIAFASPLGLKLRLHCTHGTPVLKSLDCWPALPIIVKYGGVPNLNPPAPGDDDNIIAALKQSGRVSSISLTVTSSLLEKLSAISEPFSELEELVLLSQENMQQTFPSTFLWGPRLRTVHSTGIAFPSLPLLLLPCQDLVDLQLHEIPSAGYFSPEAFTNALSGTPQLRSLTLHLLSFPRRRSLHRFPPLPGERIVLAALTHLKYRGLASTWTVLWAESMRLFSGILKLRYLASPRWTLCSSANSSSGRDCTHLSATQRLNSPRMPSLSHLPSLTCTHLFAYKYRANS